MHDLRNPKTVHFNLSEIKSHKRILRKGIGRSPWDYFGRNDAKAEAPVLWPPHVKS